MCLVAIAWRVHPRYPLVLLGNRDEYHARPAAPADWWPDHPHILGGRDLRAGGTWLAAHRSGRVAVVTNYPDRPPPSATPPSRGQLVREFVAGTRDVADYFAALAARARDYAGFSLVAADPAAAGLFAWEAQPTSRPELPPGVHALSNAPLDRPWPKVEWLAGRLARALESHADPQPSQLLDLLLHRGPVGRAAGLPAVAHQPFVTGEHYGTRASTLVLVGQQGEVRFSERRHAAGGFPAGESHFAYEIDGRTGGGTSEPGP